MSSGVRHARRFRLGLNAALLTIAAAATAFGMLGPAALVAVTAVAVIGALAGGISAGIQVAARAVVTRLFVSGHQHGEPEPRRDPRMIRWPTVRTRLLIGVQVLWNFTEPIRVPRASWPRPLSGIHWLLISSPAWLRVAQGWVVAATDFFFLYVIFDSLGFELLYHSPTAFSWAIWLLDLLALAILVRAHYDIARTAFSRKVSIAWGITFSAIDACAWFYLRRYLIAGGSYLFLVLRPSLGTSITRPDPFRLWFCLALVIALIAGKNLVRTIRPIIPSIAPGGSTAPRPRSRAMIIMGHVAIVLGCLLALTWVVQMQRRAESYYQMAESLAVKAARHSPKAATAGAAQPARDRARFEYYSGLEEKYYGAARRPWGRV
jgi:hypothetical protein